MKGTSLFLVVIFTLAATLCATAQAPGVVYIGPDGTTPTPGTVYFYPGNTKLVVSTGAAMDIESGGALKLAGTQVTATATEFNLLHGVTALNTTGQFLLSSTAVDVGAIANTTLYTVPTGKTCIVTRIVVRGASGTFNQATDPVYSIGWNSTDYNNVVTSATYTTPTTTTGIVELSPAAESTSGAAAGTLKINVTTAATASTTCTVDVLGYLI